VKSAAGNAADTAKSLGGQASNKVSGDVLDAAKDTFSEQIADAHLGETLGDMAGKLVDTMMPASPRPG